MNYENKTILIADDDQDVLDSLSLRCERLGVTVVTVDNATDAINVAKIVRTDIFCVDLELPTQNGIAAGEWFSTNDELRTTPIVFLGEKTVDVGSQRANGTPRYFLSKSTNIWNELEPLLLELLDSDTAERSHETDRQDLPTQVSQCFRNALSY